MSYRDVRNSEKSLTLERRRKLRTFTEYLSPNHLVCRGQGHFKSNNMTRLPCKLFSLSDPKLYPALRKSKLALSYSRVKETEDAILRAIRDWLSRFKQQAETSGSERDYREKRGTTVSLAHHHMCKHITRWRSSWSRYWYLVARLTRISSHTTEH